MSFDRVCAHIQKISLPFLRKKSISSNLPFANNKRRESGTLFPPSLLANPSSRFEGGLYPPSSRRGRTHAGRVLLSRSQCTCQTVTILNSCLLRAALSIHHLFHHCHFQTATIAVSHALFRNIASRDVSRFPLGSS